MHKGDSTTGWTAYVARYKEKHPNEDINYKELMKAYIGGIPV